MFFGYSIQETFVSLAAEAQLVESRQQAFGKGKKELILVVPKHNKLESAVLAGSQVELEILEHL